MIAVFLWHVFLVDAIAELFGDPYQSNAHQRLDTSTGWIITYIIGWKLSATVLLTLILD